MKAHDTGQFRDLSADDLECLAAAEWAQATALSDAPKDLVTKGLVMKSATEMQARAKLKRMLLSQVPTSH